jgi:hypothetical protein
MWKEICPGIYRATMDEVLSRFGTATEARQHAANALSRVHRLARRTNHFDRVIIFGSFVTQKPSPNDVDVILVMDDGFELRQCDDETLVIFDHERAQREIGASVFWIRPGLLINDSLEEFIMRWQRKRDGGLRGVVEVKND